jgi:hypothetical protein
MLEFALEYRHAIDVITANRDAELRAFELSKAEWNIMQQLHDVLKVSSNRVRLIFNREFGADN